MPVHLPFPVSRAPNLDAQTQYLWRFDPFDPEANLPIAALVSQGDWFVDEVVGRAFRRFERYSKGRFENYHAAIQENDPSVTRLAVASLYNQPRSEFSRRRVRYEFETAFDARTGQQRILSPSQIVRGQNATCLDLALLGTALAAQIHLYPLVH